jgi:chromosomal replication initiator protein
VPYLNENENNTPADFQRPYARRVTMREIAQTVAQHYGMTPRELITAGRRREFVRARQIAFYISRILTNRSYPEIARHYSKDHTTIIHGYEKVRDLCESDEHFRREVETIRRAIRDRPSDPGDKNNTN